MENLGSKTVIHTCLLEPLQRTFRLFKQEILLVFAFLEYNFGPAWIRIRIPNLDSLIELNPDPKKL
jgi:hypothetical protein